MPGELPAFAVGRDQITPFLFLPPDLPFYQGGVLASLLHCWVPVSARGAPLALAAHAPHAALPRACFLSLPLPSLSFTLSCRTLPAGAAAAACSPAPALSWQETRGPCPQLHHAGLRARRACGGVSRGAEGFPMPRGRSCRMRSRSFCSCFGEACWALGSEQLQSELSWPRLWRGLNSPSP